MIGVRRATVDLAKDRNGVAGIGTKHEGGLILDGRLKRQFGTRKYADRHRTILRRGKSSCTDAEVVCDEFFAHFGWACSHSVQTIVAHFDGCKTDTPESRVRHPTAPELSRVYIDLLQLLSSQCRFSSLNLHRSACRFGDPTRRTHRRLQR